jgi:hypothetical protein
MRTISYESTGGVQLSPNERNTFSGAITPGLIEKGTTIYRFSNFGNVNFGTYWTDRATVATIFEIWSHYEDFSLKSLKEVIQNNLAILNSFNNNFDLLIEAKVKSDSPLVGFRGATISQQGFEKNQQAAMINQKYLSSFGQVVHQSTDHRAGGLSQIVIPAQENRTLQNRFIFNTYKIKETSFYKNAMSIKIGWARVHSSKK